MRILAVIGTGRESGKTTTAEALIREFTKRGYAVGAIKQIHDYDFTMDTQGKDTWRMAEAGAEAVAAAAPKEVSLIKRVKKDRFKEAFKLLKVENPDLIIVEGNPKIDVPKILATNSPNKAKKILKKEEVICISSLEPELFKNKFDLPLFHPIKDSNAMAEHAKKYLKKIKK